MSATNQRIREAFEPLTGEHRLEIVGVKDKVRYIDNAAAQSVNAAWYGLESMPDGNRVIWLVGADDLPGTTDSWRELVSVAQRKVKRVIDIGRPVSKHLQYAFAGYFEMPGTPYLSLHHAVMAARAEAESGDIVLLNPGGVDFDGLQWEQRGNLFKMAVARI